MCNATLTKQHIISNDLCRPFPKGIGDLDRVIRIESERKTLCDNDTARSALKSVVVKELR